MVFADAHDVGFAVGYLFGMVAIPSTGLALLIIGLVQRSRAKAQPQLPSPTGYPGYPMPGSYPPGYPPPPGFSAGPGYPHPPAWAPPTGGDPRFPASFPASFPPPPRRSSGTALIIIGSALLALGLLGILGNAARAGSVHSGHPARVPRHHGLSVAVAESHRALCYPAAEPRPDRLGDAGTHRDQRSSARDITTR